MVTFGLEMFCLYKEVAAQPNILYKAAIGHTQRFLYSFSYTGMHLTTLQSVQQATLTTLTIIKPERARSHYMETKLSLGCPSKSVMEGMSAGDYTIPEIYKS